MRPFLGLKRNDWRAVLLLACPVLLCSCGKNPPAALVVKDSTPASVTTPASPTTTPPNAAESTTADKPTRSEPKSVTTDDPPPADPTPTKEVAKADAAESKPAQEEQKPAAAAKPETTTSAGADDEDARQRQIIERFLSVLETNPRRGTALDKIFGFHVERGTLSELLKRYQDRAASPDSAPADAGKAWMTVGLLESLRGQDAAAVAALQKAEEKLTDNALVSYYLGQALVLVGQTDSAVAAFERAIERKPAQADVLDVFQALGRVHQRAQRNDKALEIWNRLESLFPNDARVQEQIATTLLEEGDLKSALPRFEKLAKTTKDAYRQSLFRMEAAEIRVRLGESEPAIIDFEKLLGQLNPDNWLFREVRRKLEQVFLRTDDQAGLVKYYETWLEKNPEDIDAMARLSRLLAGLGRGAESRTWLEKGLKVAPRRKELRLALIDQLSYEKKFSEAAAQYESLDKLEPGNPDVLRDWGRLLLKDTDKPEAERKAAAVAIWRRMSEAKPKDALVASQVADLFRQSELTDEALAMYAKAIELAPEASQYREYLGEYFHRLNRRDEALATWRKIADGKNKTAANLGRLAEVFAGFGYLNEAITANAEALKLDKKDFSLWLKQADYLHQAERFDDALAQLTTADALAANDEEREAVLSREIKSRQGNNTLKTRIEELRRELGL